MAEDTKTESKESASENPINAWRISAKAGTRFELWDSDEDFMFAAIKPGDAMLLLDETGDNAWGVRRVFLVRRVTNGSIVYFDREVDFSAQGVESVGEGDKRVLRRIDLDVINGILQCVHPPHPSGGESDDDSCL